MEAVAAAGRHGVGWNVIDEEVSHVVGIGHERVAPLAVDVQRAGVVVIGALFMIMIVTLRQTQRTFTKVDASRRARTVLSNIENELHSACVDGGTDGSPAIEGVTNNVVESDANNLVSLTFYGTSATPKPTWHQITFNAAAGTLTETVYQVNGTAPDWTLGSLTQNTTTLLTNVSQQTLLGNTVPVFQYYAYAQYADASGNQYMIIPDGTNLTTSGSTPNSPLLTTAGLSSSDATNTVEVLITLNVGASAGRDLASGNNTLDAPVSDAISLRLTTPPNYLAAGITTDQYGPCQ